MFCNNTKKFFDKAEHYTKGIVQSELCNIESISEDLDANLARAIDQMGYLYMLDIHSDKRYLPRSPIYFFQNVKAPKGQIQKNSKRQLRIWMYLSGIKVWIRSNPECWFTQNNVCQEYRWNKIFVHQCQSGTIHASVIGVYAGTAVLCRTLHQRIKTNTGIRSISDPQVAGMATSGSVEFIGVFVYSERKTVLFWWFTTSFSKGYKGNVCI